MIIDDINIRNFIINYAKEYAPNECCGLILEKNNKIVAIKCNNSAPDKKFRFKISLEDIENNQKDGKIIGFYHSHPEDGLSSQDYAVLNKLNLVSIVCNLSNFEVKEFIPDGSIPSFLKRPFIAGKMDCIELIKDIYQKDLKITLKDFTHPSRFIDWENFEQNISNYPDWNQESFTCLRDFYLDDGFIEVGPGELREYDLILFRFPFCKTPTHVMLFRNDKIIHHPYNKDSLMEDYNKYYRKYSVNYLRYKDLS